MDNEKYGIEDHRTNEDEDSDDEEEYHSEIEIMNVNRASLHLYLCHYILFISLQIN